MYNKQFRRTVLFLAAYAIFTLTPLGAALGFVALPAAYFAYLIPKFPRPAFCQFLGCL